MTSFLLRTVEVPLGFVLSGGIALAAMAISWVARWMAWRARALDKDAAMTDWEWSIGVRLVQFFQGHYQHQQAAPLGDCPSLDKVVRILRRAPGWPVK